MLHNVNLLAKAQQMAQALQQQEMGAGRGGWFQAPASSGDPLHGGLQAMAKAYSDYQQQQALQSMYAAPGVATAQSGP
jgi:hypothetical protein